MISHRIHQNILMLGPRISKWRIKGLPLSRFYAILLISLIVAEAFSLSYTFSSVVNSIIIRNSGTILAYKLFDDCDQIGDWKVGSSKAGERQGDNTIEVDYENKVQGDASLKMTWAATGPNWGGQFYKDGRWNFSATPILRLRFKANNQLPTNFRLAIVTDPWDSFYYNFLDKIVVGEWVIIDIDLRFPEDYIEFPNLEQVRRIAFTCWDMPIDHSSSFNIDFIEKLTGPPIPLEAYIKPSGITYLTVNNSQTFQVFARGGVKPYVYTWLINNTEVQSGVLDTLSFKPSLEGKYNITCLVTDAEGAETSVSAILNVLKPSVPFPPSDLDVFRSEVRGMFIQPGWYMTHNWTLIAQTCRDYGINTIVIEVTKYYLWDDATKSAKTFEGLKNAIEVFHSYGFKVHILFVVAWEDNPTEMWTLTSDGLVNWLDFTKNSSMQMLREIVESLASNYYNADGIMLDYIRWESRTDMPLGEEAKAKFIADTGLSDVNWPTDVLEGGRYYWDFIEWRMKPVTEAVRDMRNWIKAVNPDIQVSAAVWGAFGDCGNWWPLVLGQHAADWVDKGYLDFIVPMLGGTLDGGPEDIGRKTRNSLDFYVGGPEGKVPLVGFTYIGTAENPKSIDDVVEAIRRIKENGADGWIMWRYGGPGWGGDNPDVRPYLAALRDEGLMEPVWAIQNFTVSVDLEQGQAIVSWTTTTPTRGIIEYSDTPLFNGTVRYGDFGRLFHYKDVDYVGGTILEDITWQTQHVFTIPVTNQTQFRIQSISANNVTITTIPLSIKTLS